MAQLTVGAVATPIPGGVGTAILVQNLGPGDLYVSTGAVTVGTGIKVPINRAITLTGGGSLNVISSDTSDVRYQAGATGIHTLAI